MPVMQTGSLCIAGSAWNPLRYRLMWRFTHFMVLEFAVSIAAWRQVLQCPDFDEPHQPGCRDAAFNYKRKPTRTLSSSTVADGDDDGDGGKMTGFTIAC